MTLTSVRPYAVCVAGLGAAAWFADFLNASYPLKDWLFFDLAILYGWDVLLTLACASVGHALLSRLLPDTAVTPLARVAPQPAAGPRHLRARHVRGRLPRAVPLGVRSRVAARHAGRRASARPS